MRCIVVGGSGFLGGYVTELLSKNDYETIVLDIVPPKSDVSKFFWVDITKDFDFEFFYDDIVIHLAARQYHLKPPRKNRQEYFFELNVFGTQKLLEAMARAECKNLIYFSTDMVYGKPRHLPLKSCHLKNPFGEYGKSKLMSENICEDYRNKGFNISIFRPRMIVGRGRFGILLKLFWLMDLGLPIPMIGGGTNSYQMVSVKDCAMAILLCIEHKIPNFSLNLGSANPPKVRDLLKEIVWLTGSKSIVVPTWGKMTKKCLDILGFFGIEIMYKEQYEIADKEYIVDISEAQRVLGWVPIYEDRDMLLEAYEEYKKIKANKSE